MPKVPTQFLKCTFYLYPTVEDAQAGTRLGGTGFLVGVPSNVTLGAVYPLAVTNWHVACRDNCSVIRISKADGGVDIFDVQPDQWEFIPNGYDIAVTSLVLSNAIHDISIVPIDLFLLENRIGQLEVGPGENVFMAGRFIDHDGGETNKPALRFGHISLMPEPIKQANGARLASYCIDVHSRTGFSGSPVFAFRTASEDLSQLNTIHMGQSFVGLLGIHWGQFPEHWQLQSGTLETEGQNFVTDGQVVKGLSGMTCVAPAWAILESIGHPKIKRHVEGLEQLEAMNQALGIRPLSPVPE